MHLSQYLNTDIIYSILYLYLLVSVSLYLLLKQDGCVSWLRVTLLSCRFISFLPIAVFHTTKQLPLSLSYEIVPVHKMLVYCSNKISCCFKKLLLIWSLKINQLNFT